MAQSQLQVDRIIDAYGTGATELPYGVTIPSGGTLTANGNINISGIATMGNVNSSSIVTNSVNATSFVGDGSQITGLPVVSSAKVIGLSLVF